MSDDEKTKEELELEKMVFGDALTFENGLSNDLSDLSEDSNSGDDSDEVNVDDMLFEDVGGESDGLEHHNEQTSGSESELEEPLWVDSDDEKFAVPLLSSDRLRKLRKTQAETSLSGVEYERRLRSHFEKLHKRPAWALLKTPGSIQEDDDEMAIDSEPNSLASVLSKTTTYVGSSRSHRLLPPSKLDISRVQDANKQQPSKSAVQTLEFHRTHSLLLSGGFDKTLRIYHVDGRQNPVASTLHVKDTPFQTAAFHRDGERVFAGGRRRYMYIWNLRSGSVDKISRLYGHNDTQKSMEKFVLSPCGRYFALLGSSGWLNVLSCDSCQWVSGTKVTGQIADLVWNKETEITLVTRTGEVFVYDTVARQMHSRWRDVAGVAITRLAISSKHLAIGSASGVVNVYDSTFSPTSSGVLGEPETRRPISVVENLVTPISSMQFSHDGQILSIASKAKRDALKMVHLPSVSVFQNWPTSSTPLGRVTSLAFSSNSEMFCAGNEAGHIRLWTLGHYTQSV